MDKKANARRVAFSRNPAKFSIISWNLDGLDENHLSERTRAVVDLLIKRNYTIVMLQELISPTFQFIASKLQSKYLPVVGTHNPNNGYFTATFLKKNHAQYIDHQIVDYPGTIMDRNLLITRCRIDDTRLVICNTHLESMAAHTAQRKVQLKMCFERCQQFPKEWNVIFGGDLNARDSEVTIPSNMYDVWMRCGSNASSKYTWDLNRNKNKRMPSKNQPRCRFDRLFFRDAVSAKLEPEYFGLTGLNRLVEVDYFPSDHWGVVAFFQSK